MKNHTFSIFQLSWLLSTLTVFTFINSVNAQEWVQKADMINPRLFFSVSAVDNEIYVIGGTLADPIGSVEAYDPKTNKWVKKASMLFARAGVVSCKVGGKIYAIGGWNGQNPALGTVEELIFLILVLNLIIINRDKVYRHENAFLLCPFSLTFIA